MDWPIVGYLRRKFSKPAIIPAARALSPLVTNEYCASDVGKELRQGEIISDLQYYVLEPKPGEPNNLDLIAIPVPYAIVLTPDCDLLQNFREPDDKITGVLLYEMESENIAKAKLRKGTKEWKPIKENQFSQFHVLNAVPPELDNVGMGLPSLLVDFKKYFTLPPADIYRQCQLDPPEKAWRRSRLGDLWREDIRHRALSFMGRIGLPDASDD